MSARRCLWVMCFVVAVVTLSWRWGPLWAQTRAPEPRRTIPESTIIDAAGHVHTVMPMRQTTQAQRQAATERLKVAQAPLVPGPNGLLIPDYFGNVPNYATSPLPDLNDPTHCPGPNFCGMRKFVDSLPGLNTSNNLGQKLPVAVPDTLTYPGSDYYEIEMRQYSKRLHSDLPKTLLRGYVQVNKGTDAMGQNTVKPSPIQYLGPVIVARKDRPVRIKFTNKLPTGARGKLFIPTDVTYMGAGPGPDANWANPPDMECVNTPANCFAQNRVSTHLHGGTTPWISDGTPHQWFTPPAEKSRYTKGMSYQNVPDMWFVNGKTVASCAGQTSCAVAGATNDPGAGSVTYYYTNQQSARLMFFHDHAVGITRLNVYVGLLAGYLMTDAMEQDLINGTNATGANPGLAKILPDLGMPLILQEKTFVPDNTRPFKNLKGTFQSQLAAQDPTWSTRKWGGTGQLWFPHVYMTNQNPYDMTGTNPMGRWDYGAWFWPPFTGLTYGPVANPYFDPACVSSATTYCEPPEIPGVPNPSAVPESFMDTPVINGTAYPYLDVQPKAYRFRILNGANDRYFNLSLWVANPNGASADGRQNTEVKVVPFNSTYNAKCPAPGCFPDWWYSVDQPASLDDRAGGAPDPTTRGPAMIQIANDGGFLPAPVVIRNQPINYVYNRRDITVGNVLQKALFLGPAERADVLVDFSNFAGKTLILYNDAPAPVPAADPRLDYYTGAPDQTNTGGAPSILPGFGPNIRTLLQIRVAGTGGTAPADDVNPATLAALQTALPTAFAASQEPIIVPQAPYNGVYNGNFPGDAKAYARIQDTQFTFTPLGQAAPLTLNLYPKSIIEDFQMDYGRMNAILGVEVPHTNVTNQTSIIQNYLDPPTELVAFASSVTPIGAPGDATQLWKVTHNGVDTHAIHVHMFHVQVINRVGWDGAIRPPDANELGWKDTVRMNPLEDVILALRPIALVNLPFKVPNSIRPLDPSRPIGSLMGFTNVNPLGNPVAITNALTNFGWEYVWHCHLLGHEENDMMRAIAFAVPPEAPTGLAASLLNVGTANQSVVLTWTDASASATGMTVQRAADALFTTGLTEVPLGKVTTYTDPVGNTTQTYYYRVFASNTVGSPVTGYPQTTAQSAYSNTATANPSQPPAAPSNFTATAVPQGVGALVTLTWTDNSINETYFEVQRALNPSFTYALTATAPANTVTATDGVPSATSYYYRIRAGNTLGTSPWVNATPFPIVTP